LFSIPIKRIIAKGLVRGGRVEVSRNFNGRKKIVK